VRCAFCARKQVCQGGHESAKGQGFVWRVRARNVVNGSPHGRTKALRRGVRKCWVSKRGGNGIHRHVLWVAAKGTCFLKGRPLCAAFVDTVINVYLYVQHALRSKTVQEWLPCLCHYKRQAIVQKSTAMRACAVATARGVLPHPHDAREVISPPVWNVAQIRQRTSFPQLTSFSVKTQVNQFVQNGSSSTLFVYFIC
jgi:hypothetical protein